MLNLNMSFCCPGSLTTDRPGGHQESNIIQVEQCSNRWNLSCVLSPWVSINFMRKDRRQRQKERMPKRLIRLKRPRPKRHDCEVTVPLREGVQRLTRRRDLQPTQRLLSSSLPLPYTLKNRKDSTAHSITQSVAIPVPVTFSQRGNVKFCKAESSLS